MIKDLLESYRSLIVRGGLTGSSDRGFLRNLCSLILLTADIYVTSRMDILNSN